MLMLNIFRIGLEETNLTSGNAKEKIKMETR